MGYGFYPVFKRDMRRFYRFKHQLLSSLLQPILWLAFFGMAMAGNFDRLLGAGGSIPGVPEVNYLTFMCAGIIGATILFTNIYGGFFLLFDKNWGLLREILASPIQRRDLIFGLACAGMAKSGIQALLILIFGMILGVKIFSVASYISIIVSLIGFFVFVGLFATIFICISLTLAIKIDSIEGFQGVATLLTMPLFFLSNSLYPIEGLPMIVHQIALINPLTHLTTGIRYFTIGDHFSAIGMEFSYSLIDISISFAYLLVLALLMFGIAWKTVEEMEMV